MEWNGMGNWGEGRREGEIFKRAERGDVIRRYEYFLEKGEERKRGIEEKRRGYSVERNGVKFFWGGGLGFIFLIWVLVSETRIGWEGEGEERKK